jgi:Flp pilus assembly protein TadD
LIERTAESAVTQPELLALARAHLERGETADAERVLERAQRRKGPLDSVVRVELERLRRSSSVETP